MRRHRKCPNCGTFNTNKEHCTNCGTLLSYKKRRQLAFKKEASARKKRELAYDKANPSFFETYGNHKYVAVRFFVRIIYSVWLGFIAIGTFIAWLFTAIAA